MEQGKKEDDVERDEEVHERAGGRGRGRGWGGRGRGTASYTKKTEGEKEESKKKYKYEPITPEKAKAEVVPYFYAEYGTGARAKAETELSTFLEASLKDGTSPDKKKAFVDIINAHSLRKPVSHIDLLEKKLSESMMKLLPDEKTKKLFESYLELKQIVTHECYDRKPYILETLFFPNKENEFKVADVMKKAKTTMEICIFAFTNNVLRDAVMFAFYRGVKVRIIADDECAKFLGSDIMHLASIGIPTELDNNPKVHMHNKFCIIDNLVLLTGSYNWTTQATKDNQENLLIIENEGVIKNYGKYFEELWVSFKPNFLTPAKAKETMESSDKEWE